MGWCVFVSGNFVAREHPGWPQADMEESVFLDEDYVIMLTGPGYMHVRCRRSSA